MPDEGAILGTTWVEIRPDASKLSPALDAAEKKAQGAGRVIENSLGTAFKASQDAATKLEKAVVAGSPRMQYSVYQVSAAMQNLENQIKKTTAAGGVLTGDQVRQYANLKSKVEDLTPAVESQRRTMIAARAELQAGIGVWAGWEAAASRALSDVGFSGVGQKFLIAGGYVAAAAAAIEVTKKLIDVITPESKQWYESWWGGLKNSVQGVNRAEQDLIITTARIFGAAGGTNSEYADALKGTSGNLLSPIQRAFGRKPGEKLFDAQTNALIDHYSEIEKRSVEYLKEKADLMNNTAASDKYARELKNLELIEEGYTNAQMKDGNALRALMVARDQELRDLERSNKRRDELEKERAASFKASTNQLFEHANLKNDFFSITPIPKEFTADAYPTYLKDLETRMLAVARATKVAAEEQRALALEAARASAEADIGKYLGAYGDYVKDKSKGINRDELLSLIKQRKQLLLAEDQKINDQFATSWGAMLDRQVKSYGTHAQQIEDLEKRLVTDLASNMETGFFDAITGNIKGVKDAFKKMLDEMLRDVINFIVRREVQQLLGMLGGWASSYGGGLSTYAPVSSLTPSGALGIIANPVSAQSISRSVGALSAGGGGGNPTTVHISLEPGLVARLISAGGDAGYARVIGDFNDNGPMRLTLRRNG